MNAVISGSAGVAVLVDGDRLFSIDIDRLEELTPRRANEVRFLFGDAQDRWFIEGVGASEVRRILEAEWDRAEALAVALILLDGGFSAETRVQAAQDLEEMLGVEGVAEALDAVLCAHPLPSSADVAGALELCSRASACRGGAARGREGEAARHPGRGGGIRAALRGGV